MKDKHGNPIKAGDVCFYSERPHSNYADGLVEIYEDDGVLKVGTIVVNGLNDRGYVECGRDLTNDLTLEAYTWDVCLNPTETASDLTLIEGLSAKDVTVELAAERFPLDR